MELQKVLTPSLVDLGTAWPERVPFHQLMTGKLQSEEKEWGTISGPEFKPKLSGELFIEASMYLRKHELVAVPTSIWISVQPFK